VTEQRKLLQKGGNVDDDFIVEINRRENNFSSSPVFFRELSGYPAIYPSLSLSPDIPSNRNFPDELANLCRPCSLSFYTRICRAARAGCIRSFFPPEASFLARDANYLVATPRGDNNFPDFPPVAPSTLPPPSDKLFFSSRLLFSL